MHVKHTDIETIAEKISKEIQERFESPLPRWMSLREASGYARVKRDTLMKWLDQGFIYGTKRTGKWIFDRKSIDDFFNEER